MKPEHTKKIVVGAVLVVVAGGIYLLSGRSTPILSDSVAFVCVETGRTYALARDDIPSILPARNPDTGAFTLLPMTENDGKRMVSPRYAGALDDPELAKVNKYVDVQTLEILASPR